MSGEKKGRWFINVFFFLKIMFQMQQQQMQQANEDDNFVKVRITIPALAYPGSSFQIKFNEQMYGNRKQNATQRN